MIAPAVSLPERLGLAAMAAVGAAVVWPTFTAATGIGLPCPLRTVTGVPCPTCGMTTATVALVRGRVGEAVAANPAVLVLAGLALVMAVVLVLRAVGWLGSSRPWTDTGRRIAITGVGMGAGASWVFQLHRVL